MPITRRAFGLVLSLVALAALAATIEFLPSREAAVQAAFDVTRPVSLPDMTLGASDAPVTITEYAAPTCPHCARFNGDVFPKIKSEYIDTGKVRYVFRNFPLNATDAACEMVARSIAMATLPNILRSSMPCSDSRVLYWSGPPKP